MDVLALSKLLQNPADRSSHTDSKTDNDCRRNNNCVVTPASYGSPFTSDSATASNTSQSTSVSKTPQNKNDNRNTSCNKRVKDEGSSAIWSEEEVQRLLSHRDSSSSSLRPRCKGNTRTKKEPDHEIFIKQTVGTQHVFLGSTQAAQHIVVKVHCPGSEMKDIDLDVTETNVTVESSK